MILLEETSKSNPKQAQADPSFVQIPMELQCAKLMGQDHESLLEESYRPSGPSKRQADLSKSPNQKDGQVSPVASPTEPK